MGRGLSKLQIKILQLAYQKRQEHTTPEAIAKRKEEWEKNAIMSAYAGINWKKDLGSEPPMPRDLCYADIYTLLEGSNITQASREASLSRSIGRLWRRELITWYSGYGSFRPEILITEQGIEYLKTNGYAGDEVHTGITDRPDETVHNFLQGGYGIALKTRKEVKKWKPE
jgi:hypothetical protein